MPHLTEIKIRGYHLDLYGHVNNARYLEFLEEARWAMMECSDLDWFMQQGYALVVSRIDIRYLRPAGMGDLLRIETRLDRLLPRAGIINQQVKNVQTGKAIATAEVTFAVLHPERASALPITGEIATRLESLLESEPVLES
ncbi:thioesterase-3 [Formivibrio citricus]|uniref:Thioesterase-3 n=1 Tax=Formivibrio citricus TaxID=83765 RepID=A0A1I5BJQ7_9NEIS|nr:thioesterase-3 [Formivibrio citricus]